MSTNKTNGSKVKFNECDVMMASLHSIVSKKIAKKPNKRQLSVYQCDWIYTQSICSQSTKRQTTKKKKENRISYLKITSSKRNKIHHLFTFLSDIFGFVFKLKLYESPRRRQHIKWRIDQFVGKSCYDGIFMFRRSLNDEMMVWSMADNNTNRHPMSSSSRLIRCQSNETNSSHDKRSIASLN